MMSKTFLVSKFLLLYCIITVKAFPNERASPTELELQSLSGVSDLFNALSRAVDIAIAAAQKTIDYSENELKNYANQHIDQANKEIAANAKIYINQINALKKQAKTKNKLKDIAKCLGQNEITLNSLQRKYEDDMNKCVSNTIKKSLQYAKNALTKAASLKNTVQNIGEEIKKCGYSIICLTNLGIKVTKDTIDFPKQIKKAASDTASAISHLDPEILKCTSRSISQCNAAEKKLSGKMSQCIKSKLGKFFIS